jgi:WD40-like Beta Propeller Repeat
VRFRSGGRRRCPAVKESFTPSTRRWRTSTAPTSSWRHCQAGIKKIVVRGGHYGRYVPSGHLIYMQNGTLFAVPFDLDRLETMGQAVPVLEGVIASSITGGAQLAFSSEGTLVYVSGGGAAAGPIDWMTREGKTLVLRAAKANWANPRFSPDGRKLALEIDDGQQRDIWVYDWARDRLTQLTVDSSQDSFPVWTPDGRRIVYSSDRAPVSEICIG